MLEVVKEQTGGQESGAGGVGARGERAGQAGGGGQIAKGLVGFYLHEMEPQEGSERGGMEPDTGVYRLRLAGWGMDAGGGTGLGGRGAEGPGTDGAIQVAGGGRGRSAQAPGC